jgi:hypothetical protein
MQRFALLRGEDALLDKLAKRPEFFGRRTTERNNRSAQDCSAARHTQARAATALLPILAKEFLDQERPFGSSVSGAANRISG